MNASHRRAVVRARRRPKSIAESIAGCGVWRRVPLVDAYLFGHLWQAAREGAAMFAGLVFVFAIIAGAREGGEPLEAAVWVRVLALQMPRVLAFTLPMALLYACVKAFSELSGRGELGALRAAGQGWPRLLRAPLLLGGLAGLGALWLQEWAVPRGEQARLRVLQSAAQSRARSGFQMTHTGGAGSGSIGSGSGDGFGQVVNTQVVNTQVVNTQVVNARAADFARALLHAPVVKELRPDGSLRRQIVAARGQWDERAAAMVFESGWMLEVPEFSPDTRDIKPQEQRFERLERLERFERLEVRGFPAPQRWSGVRTRRDLIAHGQFEALSLSELQAERAIASRQARFLDARRSDARRSDARRSDARRSDARRSDARRSDARRSDARRSDARRSDARRPDAQVPTLTFAIHDRFAAPLVCVALVLIGCPLGVRAPRAPGISPLGRALMVLLVYFALWLTASHLGKSGAFGPLLWAYLPLLLLIGAGLALLRRKAL